jgi:hypothetical protein
VDRGGSHRQAVIIVESLELWRSTTPIWQATNNIPPVIWWNSLDVVDGLVISKWSRAVFADMRRGGLTAANCTCSIWGEFVDTMRNIAQLETLVRRQRRLDHSGAHYRRHPSRKSRP